MKGGFVPLVYFFTFFGRGCWPFSDKRLKPKNLFISTTLVSDEAGGENTSHQTRPTSSALEGW